MTQTPPQTARLGWVIAYVPEVEPAIAFYERAFGLTRRFVAESGEYGELDTGQTTLAFATEDLARGNFDGGIHRPDAAEPPSNVELALVFDDVEAAFRHAVEAGCTPLTEPARKPQGQTVAWVRDPFGTLLEIASPLE
jgi:lactoylglutathione lyase